MNSIVLKMEDHSQGLIYDYIILIIISKILKMFNKILSHMSKSLDIPATMRYPMGA
jgi:hypothetical protein